LRRLAAMLLGRKVRDGEGAIASAARRLRSPGLYYNRTFSTAFAAIHPR
jgi:hypothetical protein